MLPGVPVATPPEQSELDAALASATRAEVVVDGERARVLGAEALRELGRLLRIAPGGPRWVRDPPGSVEVRPSIGGTETGPLLIHRDLTVRWVTWDTACVVHDPAALGEWLSARGIKGPLADLSVRASPDAAARRERFLAKAPPPVRPRMDELERDPWAFDMPVYREVFDALAAAAGANERAVAAIAAWHGAVPGPWDHTLPVERTADGLLRSFGVDEVIEVARRGLAGVVPGDGEVAARRVEAARAGLCRFLVDNAHSRGWQLKEQIPEVERRALVRAAGAAGDPRDEERAARLLIDEGPLAPPGTRLIGAAKSGALRALCTDGERGFALDGREIKRFDPDGESRVLAEVYRPGTPLAVQGRDVWFLNPIQPYSVPVDGGDVRDRRAPLSVLREARFPGQLGRFREARNRALERALPGADPDLVLDVGRDEREAYVAFGGDLPAAIELSHFWACDARDPRLLRVSKAGESEAVQLPGRPVRIGAQGERVHVVVAREDAVAVVVVGRALRPRRKRWIAARPEDVRGVILVGDEVWLRLAAPLGDVIVAVEGPDLDA